LVLGPSPHPAPAPAAEPAFFGSGASKPAGQRDENSMLFSLSALTAKAPSSFAGQTTATKEDSGLIDLRALGANSSSGQSDLLVDSVALLPLGAPPPPPQAQMLVAPSVGTSIAPPPAKSKTPLFIGLGAVVALVAVAGAYFATRPDPTPPAPVVAATTTAEVAPTAAPTAEPTAEPTAAAASASAAPSAAPVATNRPSGGGKPAGGGQTHGRHQRRSRREADVHGAPEADCASPWQLRLRPLRPHVRDALLGRQVARASC
jgi:hypothetical protein